MMNLDASCVAVSLSEAANLVLLALREGSPASSYSEEEKRVNKLHKITFSCFSSWASLRNYVEIINIINNRILSENL